MCSSRSVKLLLRMCRFTPMSEMAVSVHSVGHVFHLYIFDVLEMKLINHVQHDSIS